MKKVSQEEFDNFLEDKNYKVEQGEWMHSTSYVETRERVAFKETISYSTDIIYSIKDGNTKSI